MISRSLPRKAHPQFHNDLHHASLLGMRVFMVCHQYKINTKYTLYISYKNYLCLSFNDICIRF